MPKDALWKKRLSSWWKVFLISACTMVLLWVIGHLDFYLRTGRQSDFIFSVICRHQMYNSGCSFINTEEQVESCYCGDKEHNSFLTRWVDTFGI